ncbi:MATE family efflux transporter [Amantichitinum ursilacus]|uniref:Multidrug-efflux transporter n=1 Tax=Amantichitinum ursilacus TaxID=857265 RepID=A0A0N0XJW6_9NEIS|nr:MATE family efflux transporter [Amantichitinum ursilacus]KPC54036.1 Multidrug resistance protein MdtK [Amantichitinum ursilacus]
MTLARLWQEIRATWTLAWPIMIGQLAQVGTAFVDAVMAGHVSADDLAAVSVGASVWITIIVTMIGLLLASSPLIAHAVGANERKQISFLVQQAFYQAAMFTVVGWLLVWAAMPIFGHLGLAPAVADKAHRFLVGVAWGLPAFSFFRVCYSYSASLNSTKPMMIMALVGLALNVPANWILIYGHFGFPAMGGVGCGYASAFCLWASALMMLAWIRYSPTYRDTYPLRNWQRIDWRKQFELIKLGVPMGLMFFVEVSAFAGISLLIARLGTVPVAAHQIALNFASLVFQIPAALGTALTVRVGQALGAQQPADARFIGWAGFKMGLASAVASGLFTALGHGWIAGWYTQDAQVLALASVLLMYAALFQLFDATQVIAAGILRGYKVTRTPMIIHLTAFWIVGLPLGYVLTFGWGDHVQGYGAAGYWTALVVALGFTACLLSWQFARVSNRLARAA